MIGWIIGLVAVGMIALAAKPSASEQLPAVIARIDEAEFVRTFCELWSAGVRGRENFRIMAAELMFPGFKWPPDKKAHESVHQAWRRLDELVAAALEEPDRCP